MLAALTALLASAPLAARASAQTPATEAEPAYVDVVVPIVGSVPGPNQLQWKTDLELVNDFPTAMDVVVQLVADPDQQFRFVTLPARGRVLLPDVVGELFGSQTTLSPLLVRTPGSRSVTVRAIAYATRGAERMAPQPIAVHYGPTYAPRRILDDLPFSEEMRTNVGLVNLSERDAFFELALQKVSGRDLARTQVVLPPFAVWHGAVQTMFPLVTKGESFSIVVDTLTPETYVYASVVNNETSAGRFVDPRVGELRVAR
jgi:hypothetical protein